MCSDPFIAASLVFTDPYSYILRKIRLSPPSLYRTTHENVQDHQWLVPPPIAEDPSQRGEPPTKWHNSPSGLWESYELAMQCDLARSEHGRYGIFVGGEPVFGGSGAGAAWADIMNVNRTSAMEKFILGVRREKRGSGGVGWLVG